MWGGGGGWKGCALATIPSGPFFLDFLDPSLESGVAGTRGEKIANEVTGNKIELGIKGSGISRIRCLNHS